MRYVSTILLLLTACSTLSADHHEQGKQYFEVRQYRMKSADVAPKVDAYLVDALLPALKRQGAGAIGVFREMEEQTAPIRFVVITHKSLQHFVNASQNLGKDEAYQQAAADYLATPRTAAPLVRIRSELLYAFDCMPQMKVPELSKQGQDRVFELRVYESPTEGFGDLKVEMFNAGEVPIFLDCGILPVFMGQALVGDLMPNLTYMTVYPNKEAQTEAWAKFRLHPDWKTLSGIQKYKGSVSKIHKFQLLPLKGSEL